MIRMIVQEGLGVDVVSAGELYTALAAARILPGLILTATTKPPPSCVMLWRTGSAASLWSNFTESRCWRDRRRDGPLPQVLLRTQPGIEAHTHEYIQTGKIDSKFGLSISTGQALEALSLMAKSPHLELTGIHCHIGSQIFEVESFVQAAKIMSGFMAYVRDALGITLTELNMGGGFGIYYNHLDSPAAFRDFAKAIYGTLKEEFAALDFPHPTRISIEPGRSIIGNAGTTLYTVGSIKTIPRVRTYVAVDGGMTDNPRPALYQAKYEMALANKMSATDQIVASIAGKCCESGDMLIWDASMPWVETGDILAVASTGAYNYSMSSNYNRLPKPAVVLVREGKAHVIVERESFAGSGAQRPYPGAFKIRTRSGNE